MKGLRKFYLLINKKEIMLFIIALIIRIISAIFYRKYIGLPFKLWNFEVEGFNDFEYYYQTWVKHFLSFNWYPYSKGNIMDALNWYSYPPFFLYLISFFGIFCKWCSAIPIIILDAMCVVIVYKILDLSLNNKNIFIDSIIYCFSFVNIFYLGIYWLNPSPMNFFLLLSIYYLIKDNNYISIIYYVISVMMKQTALYYGPLFLSLYLGKQKLKDWWKPIFLIILFFIIFSIPYIFLTPINYFSHLLVSPFPNTNIRIIKPKDNQPITFVHFLIYGLKINPNLIQIINTSISTYFMMAFSISLISSFSLNSIKNNKLTYKDIIFLFTLNGFFTYLFQPRGLYKYYLTNIMPLQFIALIINLDSLKTSKLHRYIILTLYIIYNIGIIITPKLHYHILLIMFLVFIILLRFKNRK
jgi:hypothetical protein